jgi:hypothetical protein
VAVGFGNTNTPFEAGQGVGLSGAQTVNAGTDLCAVCLVVWETIGEVDVPITTITYGGQAMTAVGNTRPPMAGRCAR